MTTHYGIVDDFPNIVLVGVADVTELEAVAELLSESGVPHWSWIEPDYPRGFNAIATAPVEGEQREYLKHFKTWKAVQFRALSSIGRAADSNSASAGVRISEGVPRGGTEASVLTKM